LKVEISGDTNVIIGIDLKKKINFVENFVLGVEVARGRESY